VYYIFADSERFILSATPKSVFPVFRYRSPEGVCDIINSHQKIPIKGYVSLYYSGTFTGAAIVSGLGPTGGLLTVFQSITVYLILLLSSGTAYKAQGCFVVSST